jgi:hypothetical protein
LREGLTSKGSLKWSRTRTFRAVVDSTAPENLNASIGSDPTVYNGKLFVAFTGSDSGSGVIRFDLYEEKTGWVKGVASPYQVKSPDEASLIVKAVDKAGNEKELTLTLPVISRANPLAVLLGLLVLAVLGAVLFLVMRKKKTA